MRNRVLTGTMAIPSLGFSMASSSLRHPIASFPASTFSSHRFSKRISGNGTWVRERRSIYVKSSSSESKSDEATQKPTSASENATVSSDASGNSSSFLSLLCPLLKLFSGGDPSGQRNHALEVATSSLASAARLPWGSRVSSDINQDVSSKSPLRLQLFEFEACPFCRRVREAMTELDLSVEVYPCPKGSVRHREMVRRSGGKEMFPFLIDPNTDTLMYESGDIVKYLFKQYGNGRDPSTGLLESTLFTGWMPTLLRAGRGMSLWDKAPTDPPPKMLELFSYENNSYARLVREALCELELPYVLHNIGEGSTRMRSLLNASGSNKVPFLVDPNTGVQLGDYQKILAYLFKTYSSAASA
uniref:GST N-terminal domain-containing protein n=1 Tax=Noccaea caerulescens TaxID=107243 RepID=A0A1J3K5N2_NOCCA